MNGRCKECGKEINCQHGKPSDYECECGGQVVALQDSPLKTMTVDDVEILRTGKWNGLTWTKKDIDHVINNFEKKIAKVGIKVTEDGTHKGKPMVLPGGASLGWADQLKRVGDRLVARFVNVPKKIANLWKSGALAEKSIEGKNHFFTGDGVDRGRTLTGMLLFGNASIPAVHGLSDLVTLYQLKPAPESDFEFAYTKDDYSPATGTGDGGESSKTGPGESPNRNGNGDNDTGQHQKDPKEGDRVMDKIALTKDEYDVLLETKGRVKLAEDAATTAQNELAEIKLQLESAESAKTKAEEELKVFKDKEEKLRKEKVTEFVHTLVEKGKIEKSTEEAVIEHVLEMSEEERISYQKRAEKLPPMYEEKVKNPEVPADDDKKKSDDGDFNLQSTIEGMKKNLEAGKKEEGSG